MTEADIRAAAARGESTPVSPAGWLRLALRAVGLISLLLVFVPLHFLYRVFAYGSPFPMLFLRYAARVCGARVEVIGTHLKRDVFFVANHVSWLDILALAGASGTLSSPRPNLPKRRWSVGLPASTARSSSSASTAWAWPNRSTR